MHRWIGPFQFRDMLERAVNSDAIFPPDRGSAYLVSLRRWRQYPKFSSVPLYVGGITGQSDRFRTRIGDLIADMFGYFGHHTGGRSLHDWCKESQVHPLDLYIGWVDIGPCHRCLEEELWREMRPILNRRTPPACRLHVR